MNGAEIPVFSFAPLEETSNREGFCHRASFFREPDLSNLNNPKDSTLGFSEALDISKEEIFSRSGTSRSPVLDQPTRRENRT
jgi:hypothetical protein